ncbi:hypothetical protein [Nostoc sp.]|uniref:hypothetical protein n=1 Tax=Nostoc sp. TaxID=1180 RepID=UPI002FF54D95
MAPTVLMVTGVVMWWYCRRVKVSMQREINVAVEVNQRCPWQRSHYVKERRLAKTAVPSLNITH